MLYTPDEVFGTDRSLWLTTSMGFGARLWLKPLQRKPNVLMPVRVISAGEGYEVFVDERWRLSKPCGGSQFVQGHRYGAKAGDLPGNKRPNIPALASSRVLESTRASGKSRAAAH
jgi:hypothetical protein